jgi:hypothetical protein
MSRKSRKITFPWSLLQKTKKRLSSPRHPHRKISREKSDSCRNIRGHPDFSKKNLQDRQIEKRPSLWELSKRSTATRHRESLKRKTASKKTPHPAKNPSAVNLFAGSCNHPTMTALDIPIPPPPPSSFPSLESLTAATDLVPVYNCRPPKHLYSTKISKTVGETLDGNVNDTCIWLWSDSSNSSYWIVNSQGSGCVSISSSSFSSSSIHLTRKNFITLPRAKILGQTPNPAGCGAFPD